MDLQSTPLSRSGTLPLKFLYQKKKVSWKVIWLSHLDSNQGPKLYQNFALDRTELWDNKTLKTSEDDDPGKQHYTYSSKPQEELFCIGGFLVVEDLCFVSNYLSAKYLQLSRYFYNPTN